MPSYGRAVVLAEVGAPLEIREYPVPDPEPGAALVRVTLSNVCGSDLHVWRGELDPRKRNWALPRHHGHEMTGYIEKLGQGVTSDSDGQPLKEGDRVVYQYFFPCRRCKNCLAGRSRSGEGRGGDGLGDLTIGRQPVYDLKPAQAPQVGGAHMRR